MNRLLENLTGGYINQNRTYRQQVPLKLIALLMLLSLSLTGCAGIADKSTLERRDRSNVDSEQVLSSTSSDFVLTTDQGINPVFKPGDATTVRVGLSSDGYLNCFYQPKFGEIIRLFPNRFQSESRIVAETEVKIPPTDEFVIQFDQSDTIEQILCLVTANDVNRFVAPELRESDLISIDLDLLSDLYSREIATLDDIQDIYETVTPQHRLQSRLLKLQVK